MNFLHRTFNQVPNRNHDLNQEIKNFERSKFSPSRVTFYSTLWTCRPIYFHSISDIFKTQVQACKGLQFVDITVVKICDERSYFWQFCWTRSINSQEPDLVHIIWHHSTCVLRGFGLTEMPSRLNSVPYNNNDCLNMKTQIIKFYILAYVSYFVHATLVQSCIAIIKMS